MSIKSFVSAAKMLYAEGFYEESLCLTCSAIDACSALAYPDKGVTNRYKLFLKAHFRTISEIGFPGISASGIRIKVNTSIPELKIDSNGYVVDANGNFVYGFRWKETNANGTTTYKDKMQPLRVPLVGEDGTPKIDDNEDQDGASASITIEINNAGIISASVKYESKDANGDSATATKVVTLGKVAIATFQNPNGVTKAGGNYYKATDKDNTGLGVAAAPGDAGSATLMGGFIEASNVDLAKEFAEMIMTQRGFQANSKMITVSDEMLSELVNMKR